MIKTNYKFNIGDHVVINEKALKDLPNSCGTTGNINSYAVNSINFDYFIDAGFELLKVRESEINLIVDADMYKTGDKVINLLNHEFGTVDSYDGVSKAIRVSYADGSYSTTHKTNVRKVIENEEIEENAKIDSQSEYASSRLNPKRDSWDKYFMDIAETVSTRATCDRLHVGCVIVKDRKIVSTGYNGSISGEQHCSEVGHLYNDQGRCVRTIHAEQNAILFSNRDDLADSTAYVTHQPCENCAKLLVQSGVKRIVYKHKYDNKFSTYFLGKTRSVHLEESEL